MMLVCLLRILGVQHRRGQRREVYARHGKLRLHVILRRSSRRRHGSEGNGIVFPEIEALLEVKLVLLLLQKAARLSVHLEAVGRGWNVLVGWDALRLLILILLRMRLAVHLLHGRLIHPFCCEQMVLWRLADGAHYILIGMSSQVLWHAVLL